MMALLKTKKSKKVAKPGAKKKVPAKPKRARKASVTPEVNEAFGLEVERRVRQRAKFAPKATGTGTRRLGGRLV